MNHIYKTVWNKQAGTYVAVSEHTKAKGKSSGSSASTGCANAASLDKGQIGWMLKTCMLAILTTGILGISGVASAQVDIDALHERVIVNEGDIGDLQDLVGGHVTDISNLQSLVGASEDEITGLDDRVTANEGDIVDLDDRVTANEGDIVDLDDRVAVNEGDIVDLDGRVTSNEGKIVDLTDRAGVSEDDIQTLKDSLADLGVADDQAKGAGIKYFRANSTKGDAEATGADSVAIGPEAKAGGASSFAAGHGAIADGPSSVAIGDGAQAMATDNISIGRGAGQGTNPDIAGDRLQNIAIGAESGQEVVGQVNTALGYAAGQNVKGNDNVAFGQNAGSGIEGHENISIGLNANLDGSASRAVSIGKNTKAETEGIAIGFESVAGNTGVAIGRHSVANGTGTAVGPNAHAASGFVALGLNSTATQADITGNSAFTNQSFNGGAVSVGSGRPGEYSTRRIVNVEDGANDTDAVNVRQLRYVFEGIDLTDPAFGGGVIQDLQKQIDENLLEYVSVNDGGTDKGNRNNDGAQGVDSIAIGPDATATKANATAIGNKAGAEGESAVVLGHNIKGLGRNSTTIGNSESEAWGESGIAIGTAVISRDENSIVIGRESYADRQGAGGPSVKNSIVIGTESTSTAEEGIVLGKDSLVNSPRGIAQGSNAQALAADAMAFGTRSRASGVNSQASGTDANASGGNAQASGTRAIASGANSQASGTDAKASGAHSQASGTEASATEDFAQASGYQAEAKGLNAIAQGKGAWALEEDAMAFGTGAKALAQDAMAFGRGSSSAADSSIAIGAGAAAQNANSIALGAGAKAESNRSVALGDGAVTVGAVGTTNASLNGIAYGNFAGNNPIATVSVGTETEKRTITNVAAGRISDTSTDAINGSQLYATNKVLGNVANTTKTILGGNAALNPDGSLSMSNVGNTGENNIHDAIGYAAQGWHVGAQGGATENVKPGGKVDFSNTDGNIDIARSGTDLTFALNKDINLGATGSLTTGDTVVNNNGLTVEDAAGNKTETTGAGTTVTNVAGDTTTVGAGSIEVAGGGNTITIDANAGTIGGLTNQTINYPEFADGSGRSATEEQLGEVNATANKGWNVSTNGDLVGENVAPGGKVDFSNEDGNIVIDQTGTDLVFDLNKDLTLVDGSVTVEDTLGNVTETTAEGTTVTNAAGDTTTVGAGSIEVAGGSNTIAIDGNAGTIEGLTNVDLEGADFAKSGRAATEEQLSLVNATASAGWNVTDAAGNLANIGPNGEVKFIGDSNLTVEQTGVDDKGVVEITLNENIDLGAAGSLNIGNSLVNNDGLTVADGAGNKTETTVVGTTVTNAAGDTNIMTATGTTVTNVAGDTTVIGAGSISVTDGTGTTSIGGNQVAIGGANPILISGDTGTIGGLTNKTFDPDSFTSGQAATEDQLKLVSDVANAGWNVTDAGGNAANIGPNGVVTFEGDTNITVEQTGVDDNGVVEITLNKDIDLGPDGSLTIGDTIVDNSGVAVGGDVHLGNTGLVINNGPSITTGGIDAGGMHITNILAGVNPGDAVNYGQLQPIESFIDLDGGGFAYNGGKHMSLKDVLDSMNWNVEAPVPGEPDDGSGGSGGSGGAGGSGSGGAGGSGGSGSGSGDGTPIHNGNTLGFVEGDNIVISKSDRFNDAGERVGADIKVAVSQDLKVNSITAVHIQADEIQISNGGPIINQDGIDMSDKRITNMADGVAQNDAVNVGQLERATSNLQGQVNDLRGDLRRQDKKLSAGVAAAMATASLPQAYLPGKTMMGMAAGTWNGESGMAIGFSGITDNGKWVYKLSGNATSRGDYGGAVGVGYQW